MERTDTCGPLVSLLTRGLAERGSGGLGSLEGSAARQDAGVLDPLLQSAAGICFIRFGGNTGAPSFPVVFHGNATESETLVAGMDIPLWYHPKGNCFPSKRCRSC